MITVMNVFIRSLIVVVFAGILFMSCARQKSIYPKRDRAVRKVAKLLAKYPDIIKSDSTFKVDSSTQIIEGEQVFFDENKEAQVQNSMDSLLAEMRDKCPQLFGADAIKYINPVVQEGPIVNLPSPISNMRNSILKLVTIESMMKPIEYDTAGAKVFVSAKGNKVKVKLEFPKTTIKETKAKNIVIPCPEESYWRSIWKVKEVIGVLLLFIMLLLGLVLCMK